MSTGQVNDFKTTLVSEDPRAAGSGQVGVVLGGQVARLCPLRAGVNTVPLSFQPPRA